MDSDGQSIKGYRLNKATSSSWTAGGTGNQTGWYGGNFTGSEITTKWVDGPHGERTLAAETDGDSNSDYDGGYVKAINNLDINKSHLSIVYVKRISSAASGSVYHGTGAGTNQITSLGNSSNTNPYFQYHGAQLFPQDVWCVSIGVIQANNDSNTDGSLYTGSSALQGIYRCDTGQKIGNGHNAWKMGSAGATLSNGIRFFHYYSTDANCKLQWAKPGFYEINGDEPSLSQILSGGASKGLHTNGGDVYAANYYDSNDTSYVVNPAGDSQMNQIHLADYVRHLGDLNSYFGFNGADQWKLHLGGGDRLITTTSQFTSNLNVAAPLYYDKDDTSYYLNANSTGISLNVAGKVKAEGGFTVDDNAKFYSWRALENTGSSSNQYHKIARITGGQSSRFIIELAGRSTSYSDSVLPAFGKIVGQLNNDNNFDIVYYNASATDEVVDEVGQVDVSTSATDIYVRCGQFSELSATAHISDGTIAPTSAIAANGSVSAPTNYVQATEYKLWNTGNDGSGSGLDADKLDGNEGSAYFRNNYTSGGDLNTDTASGIYRFQNTELNRPGSITYGTLVTFNNTSDTGFQLVGDYHGTGLYWRGGNSSTFNGSGTNTNWFKIWHDGNDGSGSGLDADTLDGQHASAFLTSSSPVPAHTQAISTITGLQTSLDSKAYYDHIRSLGSQAFTAGSNPNITTAQLIGEIESDGGFDSFTSVFKTSWSYAGNYNLSDAGRFTETAGTSWITWTDNSSDSVRGNITALAIAPNTGGSAGKVFIYNDQGSSYAPGWREVWTNTSDGAGSGLDADKLDGQEGSHYLDYSNFTGTPTIPTNSTFVDLSNTQTISGAKTFTSNGHKHSGHYYMTAYDSAGNHYPHFQDGSDNGGTTVNWRQYYGSAYKSHTWISDSSGNMQFNFNGNIRALDGIYYGSSTARYINPTSTSRINRLEIENTSNQSTPTAYMQIGSDGFIFGGNNNGYEANSAQISAGYHTGNSLNIVGMGTNSSNRRIDFWAEGGFYVSGVIRDKDSTSHYLDLGSTGTSLNVAGHIYSGGVIQAGTTLLGDTVICLNGSNGFHLRQNGTTNVIAKLSGSTESTLEVDHIKGLKLDTANSQVIGYNTTNYGNAYGYLGVDVNGKLGVIEKEITFSIEGTGWVGRHSNPVKILDAPGADKMIVVQEINILINYTAPIGIGSNGICQTNDNTAYMIGFYQGSGTNGNFTVTGVMPRATMQFTTTTNDRIVNRDVPVEGTKLYPNKALYWKTTRNASSSFGSYPGAQHIVKVRYRIVDVSTEFTGAYASAQNINSSSITSISQAY